jgi:hypothetical protein
MISRRGKKPLFPKASPPPPHTHTYTHNPPPAAANLQLDPAPLVTAVLSLPKRFHRLGLTVACRANSLSLSLSLSIYIPPCPSSRHRLAISLAISHPANFVTMPERGRCAEWRKRLASYGTTLTLYTASKRPFDT